MYKALDLRTEEHVAIKVLFNIFSQDTEVKQRFLREGQIQSQIQHPHIVRVFDVFEERGLTGFALEWCDGGDLRSYLRAREVPFDNEQLTQLFLPVLDAVMYAHDHQIVHRDLKPANILLTQVDGVLVPKVTDFGIAKIFEGYDTGTITNSMMGTPRYMSPEQLKDSKHIDHRADVYSLGVILYEWATGQPPYKGKIQKLFVDVFSKPIPYPHAAPARFQEFLLQCLQKEPSYRFQSVSLMKDALVLAMHANVAHMSFLEALPSGDFKATTVDKKMPDMSGYQGYLEQFDEQEDAEKPAKTSKKVSFGMGLLWIFALVGVLAIVGAGLFVLWGVDSSTEPASRRPAKGKELHTPTKGIQKVSPAPSKRLSERRVPRRPAVKERAVITKQLPTKKTSTLIRRARRRKKVVRERRKKQSARTGRRFAGLVRMRLGKNWLAIGHHKDCADALTYVGHAISVDRRGAVYLSISFRGAVTFAGKRYVKRKGVLFAKLSSSGRVLWVWQLLQTTFVRGKSGFFVNARGIWLHVTGNTLRKTGRRIITGSNSLRSYPTVIHLTKGGRLKWIVPIRQDTSAPRVRDMKVDRSGNTYLIGRFYKRLIVGSKSLQSSFRRGLFVLKIDRRGKYIWHHFLKQTRNSAVVYYLSMAPRGDVYISGFFRGSFQWNKKVKMESVLGYKRAGFLLRMSGQDKEVRWTKIFPHVLGASSIKMVASETLSPLVFLRARLRKNAPVYRLRDANIPIQSKYFSLFMRFSQDGKYMWSKPASILPEVMKVARGSYYMMKSTHMRYGDSAGWFKKKTYKHGHSDMLLGRLSRHGKWYFLKRFGGPDSELVTDFSVDRRGWMWCTGLLLGKTYEVAGKTFKSCSGKRNLMLFVKK